MSASQTPRPRTTRRTAAKSTSAAPRQRLQPGDRQHMILEGAISYFAEFGFDGRTRELAQHLGISQALLFRYFPSKAALIDRVYDVVFLNRWSSTWEDVIVDRGQPLASRLKSFYKDYNRSIDRYEVIRISLFSALRGESISERYFARIRDRLIHPIVLEFRHALALPSAQALPVSVYEEELVFSLHAMVIYAIMRKHVFHLGSVQDPDFMIELYVDSFMAGAREAFARVHARVDVETRSESIRRP
jgi:AcrR family transcriptional regulator